MDLTRIMKTLTQGLRENIKLLYFRRCFPSKILIRTNNVNKDIFQGYHSVIIWVTKYFIYKHRHDHDRPPEKDDGPKPGTSREADIKTVINKLLSNWQWRHRAFLGEENVDAVQ